MTDRVLAERELNRALLARQMLLERAPVAIPRALERMGGLQAQYAPSIYVGLWSRMEGFEREALTRALERRSVVQGTLMRSTIHLVSARDYWPLALAVERAGRDGWLKANRDGLRARDMSTAARLLRPRFAGGALRRGEIEQLIGKPQAALDAARFRAYGGRRLEVEPGLAGEVDALRARGHDVRVADSPHGFGVGQMILADGDALVGGSDGRADGHAAGL